LAEMDIPVRPFFYPLSSLPAYPMARVKYKPMNPVSYDISYRGINLPGSAILTESQIDWICDGIKKLISTRSL
jgi:perosamine synthetase